MKVAFFLGALEKGGAESLVYDISRNHQSAPFESCCIFRKRGGYYNDFQKTGIPLFQVERKGSLIRYIHTLRRIIRQNGIDIVHSQTPSNTLICILVVLFTPIKIVTTLHGFSFATSSVWKRRLVYAFSKRIICVSNFEKDYYLDHWKLKTNDKFTVVHNGIDFSKLDKAPKPQDIPIKEDVLSIVMVGSFIPGRSQFFICTVLNELCKAGIPFHMYFAGRRDMTLPERYDKCVQYCTQHGLTENVHFLGQHPDIPALLSQMDLFLYASEHDTFGIAIIEAIAAGLPVIVNDWDVIKEITENGRYASLYKTGDIADCTERILAFWKNRDNPVFKDQLQRNASYIRETYSIERHIKQLNDIYLNCTHS